MPLRNSSKQTFYTRWIEIAGERREVMMNGPRAMIQVTDNSDESNRITGSLGEQSRHCRSSRRGGMWGRIEAPIAGETSYESRLALAETREATMNEASLRTRRFCRER